MNGVLVGLALAALGTLSPVDTDALTALRARFSTSITSRAEPPPQVRYCPDNTCEVFTGSRTATAGAVADFALLYLWAVSQYTYLEDWHRGAQPPAVAGVLRRVGGRCSQGTEQTHVACALRWLATSSGVVVSFVRYDEGAVTEEPIDLDGELRRLK